MIATSTNFIPLTGNSGNPTSGPIELGDAQRLQLDSSGAAMITGDGSGNASVQVGNMTLNSTSTVTLATSGGFTGVSAATLASGTGGAFVWNGSVTATGSANGFGHFLLGAAGGTTSGKKGIAGFGRKVGSANTLFSFLDLNGNLLKTEFSAAHLIVVDGTNGSDSSGIGTELSPYKTVAQGIIAANAIASSTSPVAILIKPGIYVLAGANSGMTPASHVAVIGSGRGVTIIQNHTDYNAVYFPNSNCLLKDITLDTADLAGAHNGISVQLPPGGITPSNVIFDNVDFICSYDGVNPGGNGTAGGGTGPFCWFFRNCHFHGACWMYYDQAGISALFLNCNWVGDGTIPRLDGMPQYAAVVAGAANSRTVVAGGNINFTDSSSNANLWANAGVVANGGQILFSATNVSIACPNAPSTAMVAPFAYNAGVGGGGAVQVGDGVAFSAYSFFGNSNFSMPTVQFINATQSLAVSGSAVTPYFNRHRGVFTVSADAGTLASNTLTVNAPVNAAADGNRMGLRIKNTNSGSTAMTLSLNSIYNVGGASVGTIAAGKRAYLDVSFDADNSKWDLIGMTSGL
jgi:hypothetical protein